MPTNPEDFQKSRRPWSRWKHEILIRYLEAMVAILQRAGTVYCIDGFAGPGKYLDDNEEGSPLLAAKHAKDLALSNKPYALNCINVESDSSVFDNLEDSTSEYRTWVKNYCGVFGDHVGKILDDIGYKPALFFLDPLGVKGLEWEKLVPVLERRQTTELLIRFDTNAVLRHTGRDVSHHSTFNAILGEASSEYWQRYLIECGKSSDARRECLSNAYEDKLRLHFDFVGRIPILSSDESLKYFLLYATRSAKGMQVMNDVFFTMQDLRDRTLDEEKLEHERIIQLDMFEPSPEEKTLGELRFLRQEVLEVLKQVESVKRDELRGRVASRADNFGRFSGSQFTAVLGGRAWGITLQKDFVSLKSQIEIHRGGTPGNDKAIVSLNH